MTDNILLTRRQSVTLFFVIVIAIFFARSVYTSHPELGGDAKRKWITSVLLSENNDPGVLLDDWHHSARWGVVGPVALVNELKGASLFNYYFTPLIFYAFLFAMIMVFAYQSIPISLIGIFAVLLFYEPMFFRASSQLQPYVFGLTYVVSALWLTNKYLSSDKIGFLVLAAVFAFLAYGAKETYIFFYPGVFLFLWIRKGFVVTMTFGFMLLFLLAGETLFFNAISGELNFGRIQYLSEGKHVDEMQEKYTNISYYKLIATRWQKIPDFNQSISVVSGIYALFLIATGRFFKLNNYVLAIYFVTISYSLSLTFVPLSIDPLMPVQPLFGRYLTPIMPLMVFCFIFSVCDSFRFLSDRAGFNVKLILNTVGIIFLAFCIIKESPFTMKERTNMYPNKQSFMWRYDDLVEMFESGHGICYRNLFTKSHTTKFFTQLLYPPIADNNIEISRLSHQNGNKYSIIHSKNYKADQLNGYIRAIDLSPVESIDGCPAR